MKQVSTVLGKIFITSVLNTSLHALQNGYKKEGNLCHLLSILMGLEDIMLSEISQTKKDKYLISLICGI